MTDLHNRLRRSITRIPDRLSTTKGEVLRREWAEGMANTINARLADEHSLGLVPVHPHLWTDPVLFRLFEGFVVLDHPEGTQQFEDYIQLNNPRVAIHDCPTWWSLYDGRAPRFVVCPDKGKSVPLSNICNRLTSAEWHGPWESRPVWAYAPGSHSSDPVRSLVKVLNPVDPAWIERVR